MRITFPVTRALGLLMAALSAAGCSGTRSVSGSLGDGNSPDASQGASRADLAGVGFSAPANHRPTSVGCSMVRPPGLQSAVPSGGCASDSQCTGGQNGRCTPARTEPICTYDSCFTDTDCGGGVCECGGPDGVGRSANICLGGNCTVDPDCGPGGYCSPSYGTSCGAYGGVAGYFCHTAEDQCNNDDQCVDAGAGYCAYQPTTGSWACVYSFCAG
jgi:hypothetical protein